MTYYPPPPSLTDAEAEVWAQTVNYHMELVYGGRSGTAELYAGHKGRPLTLRLERRSVIAAKRDGPGADPTAVRALAASLRRKR